MMKTTIIAVAVAALCACGEGRSTGPAAPAVDPRAAAIQKYYDSKPVVVSLNNTTICYAPNQSTYYATNLNPYKSVGVTMVRVPSETGQQICWKHVWPAAAQFTFVRGNGDIVLGRYILEKVGDEETEPFGKVSPFRMTFHPSAFGARLIAAKLATPPQQTVDGQATFSKDVDGHLILNAL